MRIHGFGPLVQRYDHSIWPPKLTGRVTGAHIRLADAPLETELIRKRCGLLVSSPRAGKRAFKGIVDASGCLGYIAAPITVQDRAIGMLHADGPDPTES